MMALKLTADAADSESRQPRGEMKEKGGYECEFVESPPKQLQSECSICMLVLREPRIISCCGHSFCKTCIGRIQRDGKPCPLCNEPGFTTVANGGLKRSLSEFLVRCPHRELGCEWVDELGKLDQHLNADPQPERQFEGCPFASIECIHCKDPMRRHVIAGHQNEDCPKRPYTCEFCEEYESTFEDVVNHWAECKCYLLLCPNNCNPSGSGIERQNLEHHVKEECPLTVVECDFHYAGCGVKRPRKDMAGHMKEESVAHTSLLAAENQRQTKQLLEKDEKVLSLTQLQHATEQKCRELEETITLTSQKLMSNHMKLKGEVGNTQAIVAAVLILVISVAFGSLVFYYYVPLQREHRDLADSVTQVTQHHKEHRDLADSVTQYCKEHQDLADSVTQVTQHHKEHRDLADSVTQYRKEHQDLADSVTQDRKEHRDLADSVTQDRKEHLDLVDRVTQDFSVQFQTAYGKLAPVDIEMCGFKYKYLSPVHSTPFYNRLFGYKMSLVVYTNGVGDGEGTHVSVFIRLMRGEFDSYLDWPFRGNITVQLLNQLEDKQHHTRTIAYTDTTPDSNAGRVTDAERAHRWGFHKFISHSELDSYLKDDDDCLIFKIL